MLLAGLPLLVVIGALLLTQSATRAAIVGSVTAAVVGAGWFTLTAADAATAALQWWPLMLEVLLIVAGGIAFAEVGRRTGAQDQISTWLRGALGSGVAPVLAIVHGVIPLAESLTGFGIGAALAVPLLVSLGLAGGRAATIGLLGLCAVPWGSMGPGTLIAANLGGVGFDALGVASAVASLPIFLGVGVVAALLVAAPGARAGAVLAATGSGTVLWASILGASIAFGTPPAGAVGAAVTLLVHLGFRRLRTRGAAGLSVPARALTGYAVLLGGVLAASLLVRTAGGADTPWRYLASPALWLLVATIVAGLAQPAALRSAIVPTVRTWTHVGPATALFIVLGVLMSISGMSAQLAEDLAGLGHGYLFAVPLIGAAGGFITGSNTGANAMFAAPQAAVVTAIGSDLMPAMAAHNVAASLLVMAAPARVELAARLCPDDPPRAPIQRTLLVLTGILVVLLGGGLVLLESL